MLAIKTPIGKEEDKDSQSDQQMQENNWKLKNNSLMHDREMAILCKLFRQGKLEREISF
jgi:hypothetical protein